MPANASFNQDTRQNLLEAAEKLFVERGIHGTSLRAITKEAAANLASVNYHFGSKEGLIKAVFERRFGPLNEERAELLAQARADGQRLRVEDVVRAFIAPTLQYVHDQNLHRFACLTARSLFLPPEDPVLTPLLAAFRETRQRFLDALHEAMPDLSEEEVGWRFHYMVGSMAHVAALGPMIEKLSGGICSVSDPEKVTASLVGFITAGMKGTPVPSTPIGPSRDSSPETMQ